MDSQLKEYLSQYAPEGSSLYYASLYYPEFEKQNIIALHGFYQEIKKIRYQIHDPGIAKIKLDWWRQEIEKISYQSSQHPLVRQLSTIKKHYAFDINQLLKIINTEETLLQNYFLTEQEKYTAYENSIGVLWQLCCGLSTQLSISDISWIIKTASTIQCLDDAFNLHSNLTTELCNLSEEFLSENNFDRLSLKQINPILLWNKLTKPYVEIQKSQLEKLLNVNQTIPYLLPMILIDIYMVRSKKVINSKQVIDNDILPIRKLFIAWKNYRKIGAN